MSISTLNCIIHALILAICFVAQALKQTTLSAAFGALHLT